jgi:hypothetical protein
MRRITSEELAERFRGKRVAVVGSAPGVLRNAPDFVDAHDIVVRVNNYKLGRAQGYRCDVFYSFFGGSIRKGSGELRRDGVDLCVCKCPDSMPIDSAWHRVRGKVNGIDFRYIYKQRKDWWFCDTWIPSDEHFLRTFNLLGQHIPTTGFSAIIDVLRLEPRSVYLTGFDFFESGMHNVDELWRRGDETDPIGHRPLVERAWLFSNRHSFPMLFDQCLEQAYDATYRHTTIQHAI